MKTQSASLAFILFLAGIILPAPALAGESKFEPGQIWTYKTRPQEPESTLTILKIEENLADTTVVHIAINKVQIKHPNGTFITRIGHAPIGITPLRKSVVKRVGGTNPDELDMTGYQQWREAWNAGSAGIFTITVAEIVEHIETAVNKNAPVE